MRKPSNPTPHRIRSIQLPCQSADPPRRPNPNENCLPAQAPNRPKPIRCKPIPHPTAALALAFHARRPPHPPRHAQTTAKPPMHPPADGPDGPPNAQTASRRPHSRSNSHKYPEKSPLFAACPCCWSLNQIIDSPQKRQYPCKSTCCVLAAYSLNPCCLLGTFPATRLRETANF